MANTENIEAKLCAYVDGELDAAGRAEIEAHLAANPQHKDLIDELRTQRDLLRDLPRAAAPGDLLETVQSQMERSALLDGAHAPDIAGRISPWPRIMSVAAVLTMAIGLFAVIYYVVKQGNPNAANNRPQYATGVMRPSASSSPTVGEGGLASSERDKDLSRLKSTEADTVDRARKLAAAEAVPGAPPAATQPAYDVFASGGAASGNVADNKKGGDAIPLTNIFAADTDTEQTQQAQEKIKRSGNAVPSDSLVMVVASADPTQAQGEVQKYLDDKKIHWEAVTEPVPQMNFPESQSFAGSRLGNHRMEMSSKEERQFSGAKGGAGGTGATGGPGGFGGVNGKLAAGAIDSKSAASQADNAGAFANSSDGNASSNANQQQQGEAVHQQAQQRQPMPLQQIAQPQDDVALRKDASAAATATANAAQQQSPAPPQAQRQEQQQIALAPNAALPSNSASNAIAPPPYDLSPPTAAPAVAAPSTSPAAAPAAAPALKQSQDLSKQASEPPAAPSQQKATESPQRQIALDETAIPDQQQQAQQLQQNAPAFIVARGLTRRQVSELNSSLATQNAGRVYNYRRSGDNFIPAPTAALSTRQPALSLEAASLTGAGAGATRTPAAPGAVAATTQPLTIAAATAPIAVTASTPSATTAPAQKPAVVAAAADSLKAPLKKDTITTQPTGRAAATPPPTTSMALAGSVLGVTGATTHPTDERLDVVICIQPPAQPQVAPNAAIAAPPPPASQSTVAPNAPISAPAESDTATTEPAAPNDTPPADSPADNAAK